VTEGEPGESLVSRELKKLKLPTNSLKKMQRSAREGGNGLPFQISKKKVTGTTPDTKKQT